MASDFRSDAVFLNVPFDAGYERQFHALISAIVALGRIPRCVLEIPEGGQGRLARIAAHISKCAVSVHDLSRVGLPVRFNMPFELGLACSLAQRNRRHSFVLLEKKPHRLARTLSDMGGIDPLIHRGTVRGTITCILDVLRSPIDHPDPREVLALYNGLRVVSGQLKTDYGVPTVYGRAIFLDLVAAATTLATDLGLLAADPAIEAA